MPGILASLDSHEVQSRSGIKTTDLLAGVRSMTNIKLRLAFSALFQTLAQLVVGGGRTRHAANDLICDCSPLFLIGI